MVIKLRKHVIVIVVFALIISVIVAGVIVYFLVNRLTINGNNLVLDSGLDYIFIISLIFTGTMLTTLVSQRLLNGRSMLLEDADLADFESADEQRQPRKTGSVKWFNGSKGYGFITNQEGEDVFVHYKSIRGSRRMLYRGQEVEYFETIENNRLQALEVNINE